MNYIIIQIIVCNRMRTLLILFRTIMFLIKFYQINIWKHILTNIISFNIYAIIIDMKLIIYRCNFSSY